MKIDEVDVKRKAFAGVYINRAKDSSCEVINAQGPILGQFTDAYPSEGYLFFSGYTGLSTKSLSFLSVTVWLL